MLAPALNKGVSRLLPNRAYGYVQRAAEITFDKWAARILENTVPDVVVAYENTALNTFRTAKALGVKCVLDAASLHHVEQDKFYETKISKRLKLKIDSSKDQEIELADVIITASELAAESYRRHLRNKFIVSIPLGVDTDTFFPARERSTEGVSPFIFVFVGSANAKKGFDTVLSAFDALLDRGLNAELWLAGHLDMEVSHRAGFKVLGMLSHKELSKVLRQTHCLLLTSRFDSFGLVVLEALASGIPVIVSEMVGAKQIVVEGESGFIVPMGDVAALSGRMRELAKNPARAAAMGCAARQVAEQNGWSAYHERVQSLIYSIA
jgi:glycosyltransferase involved in cell wall biosynthesis